VHDECLTFIELPDIICRMIENGKIDSAWKKTYEISYALWRIAGNVKNKNFADKIAGKSIDLIGFAADVDYDGVLKILPGLKSLIHFAGDIGVINMENRDIFFKEIGNLESAIADLPIYSLPESEKINIKEFFLSRTGKTENEEIGNDVGNNEKSEIRQSAILEKIRQIGNCRLGDIQIVLPNTSERTIRYDLEALVQKKLVERVGVGGRGVYYRIPQSDQVSG
jgi:hypothetical protein